MNTGINNDTCCEAKIHVANQDLRCELKTGKIFRVIDEERAGEKLLEPKVIRYG